MRKKITLSGLLVQSKLKEKFKLLAVIAISLTANLQAQVVETKTTTGAGTWTCPAGVTSVTVECWGGGGAGGAAKATGGGTGNQQRGGGGAGGNYTKSTISVSAASNPYSISVGAGGISSAVHQAKIAGGDSWFGSISTVFAAGGGGGESAIGSNASSAPYSPAYYGVGGTLGATGVASGTSNVFRYGGTGAAGASNVTGGGGGSAGSTGNGGNASGVTAGTAGTGGGAAGGAGTTASNVVGGNGSLPGSGGAGSPSNNAVTRLGGTGGNGKIIITYNYDQPATSASSINFSVVGSDAMTINWTNGSGSNRVIFVKETSADATAPTDGTSYTASANWSSKGTQLGSTGLYCVYNGTGSTVSLSNLIPSTTYYVYIYEYFGTAGYENYETIGVSANQATTASISPFILLTGSLTAFSNTFNGDISEEKTYTVEGTNLTDDITATAPAGFTVSKTSGSGFASSVVYAQSGGTVSTQTVYVRFEPTAVQAYSGDITHTSTGATQKIQAVSGTGISAAPSVSISSPATNTTAVIGGSVVLTATAIPIGSRTIISVVFKDGIDVISGTVTQNGNDFSITYANFPSGSRSITAFATDNQSNVTTSSAITVRGITAHTGDKYAQSAITWANGPWYDAASGGNEVTAPAAGDNVFTNGYAVSVNADATCDNLTFKIATSGSSVSNQLSVSNGMTLTVRGKIDGTDTPASGSSHTLYNSAGTGTIKLTGETLSSPFSLIGNNAIGADLATDVAGMFKPVNLVIDPVNLSNRYQFGTSTVNYIHGAGKFTIKTNTKLDIKTVMQLGTSVGNEIIVEEGADVTTTNHFKGSVGNKDRIKKATINGTVTFGDNAQLVVEELVLGNNAYIKTSNSHQTNADVLTWDGWWGAKTLSSPPVVADFGTPASLTMGTNTTIEFAKTGNQNINGIVPANGAGYTSFSIPYVNLNVSGVGIKTIQTDLTVTGTLNVATGTTLTIASGKTLTLASGAVLNVAAGGKLTNNGTITNGGTVNFLSDATNGSATFNGTAISGGTINIKHNLTSGRNWYISSPIATMSSSSLPAGTLWKYNEPNTGITASPGTASWDNITSAENLEVMKGYVFKPTSTGDVTFTGTLNTADKDITIYRTENANAKRGFNLIGNPYLSYINIENLASNTDLEPTIWYRSHNSGYVNDTYNIPGNLSTGLSGKAVSKFIPPMQAFWVRVASTKASATVNLLNANRDHADIVNNKYRAPAANASVNQVVRLKVESEGIADEAIVYFNTNASYNLDNYDSPKMFNNSTTMPEIYTQVGDEQLVINGYKSLEDVSVVPLGFVTQKAGSFSLKINEFTNFDSEAKVLLVDATKPAESFDLTDGTSYNFTAEVTPASTDRFSLIFRSPGVSTGLENTQNNDLLAFYNNGLSIICNNDKLIGSMLSVYNGVGQLMISKQITAKNMILNELFAQGVYVVKTNSISKKVIIK